MKTPFKRPPLLLTDELSIHSEAEKRASSARACAEKLARKMGTSVHLLHVEQVTLYPSQAARFKPLLKKHLEHQKKQLARVASAMTIPAKPILLDGDPASTIVSQSGKRDAYELIIQGTHGRSGLSRLLIGSVAEQVIRQSRIPVLTIGPKAQAKADTFLASAPLRILVPTALTPNSELAEKYALRLAIRLGAEVVLFHSLHESLHPVLQTAFAVPSSSMQLGDLLEELKSDAHKKLTRKSKMYAQEGVTCSTILYDQTFTATESILNEARKSSASLIVMGTHGRSRASEAFFGRTARDVILEAEIPVITVRSKRK